MLCLDTRTAQVLTRLGLPEVRLITLPELESADPELLSVKTTRLPVEYFWTCGPALLLHVFQRDSQIPMVTYLDADQLFFSSLAPIYDELGDGSILVIEHRYLHREPGDHRFITRFNVGFLIFRRSAEGLACLARWREQCLTWCHDRQEGTLYGDQGYLTEWPERYRGVVVLQHPGGGVAPWNLRNHPLTTVDGQVRVAGVPLILFHYSGLRRVNRWLYELHVWRYHHRRLNATVRRGIYAHYIRELARAERRLRQIDGFQRGGSYSRRSSAWRQARRALTNSQTSAPWIRWQRFMISLGPWVF